MKTPMVLNYLYWTMVITIKNSFFLNFDTTADISQEIYHCWGMNQPIKQVFFFSESFGDKKPKLGREDGHPISQGVHVTRTNDINDESYPIFAGYIYICICVFLIWFYSNNETYSDTDE